MAEVIIKCRPTSFSNDKQHTKLTFLFSLKIDNSTPLYQHNGFNSQQLRHQIYFNPSR